MCKRFISGFLVVLMLITMYPITTAAQTSTNYALGKPYSTSVTCQSSFGNSSTLVTDGNKYSSAYITDNGAGGGSPVSLTVYLKGVYTLDRVKIWHYWADGRTYNNTKTEISEDGANWTTVFDSAYSGEYKESEQGKLITFKPSRVCYIRDWIQGSDKDNQNRWVEIQAFGPPQTGQDVKQNLPLNDPLESTTNITGLNPGTVSLTQDRAGGNYAVKVAAGDNTTQNWVYYNLATSNPFDITQFSQVRLWVKPGPGAKWIEFLTRDNTAQTDCKILSDRDADGAFKVGSDLQSGKWNKVTLDLTKTTSPTMVQAKNLWVRTNDISTWYYDEITSIYSPAYNLDLSRLVNAQTQLVNGELRFKSNGVNGYDTTPTVLGSQNQPIYSRTDTTQGDFQAGTADGVYADTDGKLKLQNAGTSYTYGATLNADFNGTHSNTETANDAVKLAGGSTTVPLTSLLSEKAMPSAQGWVEWDVTQQVQEALAQGLTQVDFLIRYKYEDKPLNTTESESDFSSNNAASNKPTLTVTASTGGGDKNPTKDTDINEAWSTTNYGTATSMLVADRYDGSYHHRRRIIMSFSLSGVISATSAKLKLYYNGWGWHDPVGKIVQVYKLTRPNWLETGATWGLYTASSGWSSSGGDYTSTPAVSSYTYGAYSSSGTYTHPAQDISSAGVTSGATITYNKTTPTGTALTVEVRTSSDGGSTWSAWTAKNSGDTIIPSGTNLSNYRVQWRANLSTTDAQITPSLDDVTINVPCGGSIQGTYTSPVLDISTGYSAADSTISWNKADAVADSQVVGTAQVETRISTDGGNNYGPWQAATNGSPIPGITLATDLSNARLQYRVTLSTSNATVTPLLYDITLNITGADQSTPAASGKIKGITINSSYVDSSGPLSALPAQRLLLSGVSPATMAMSGDGSSLFYKNPQDGNKLYLLNLLTGANTLISNTVTNEIKTNYSGAKVAFKDSGNSLYLYDRSTGSTTTVSASVGDFEIQDDGTVFYFRTDSNYFYKLAPSAAPPGQNLTTGPASYLDIPRTGNKVFFSNTTQLSKLTLTTAGWRSSALTTAAKNITGLWANADGSLVFFKTDDGLFCYRVSAKSVRKLDVTATNVIRVTDDNKLAVLGPNYEYQLYDGNTDSAADIGPSNAVANYTFVVDGAGTKMAYVATGGLSTYYHNGVQGPERYLLSFDGKGSWHSYKSGKWELVTDSIPTAQQFQEKGMTANEINTLTADDFNKLYVDGREIYGLDIAVYFASVDPYTTPSIKSIVVSVQGSLDGGGLEETPLQKPLYAKKQQDFNASGWRRIKRIYTVELYPRDGETYYFVTTDGTSCKSYKNGQWVTVDTGLFNDLEANWITLTQQGMTATALRSIPEDFLNMLLPADNFSVVYVQKVQDASTEGYTSEVDVDYVGTEFVSANLALKVTLTDGTVRQYQGLTKSEVEDFMNWLSQRQYNKGPIFYKLVIGSATPGVTQVNDYLNYYLIQFVSVEEQ